MDETKAGDLEYKTIFEKGDHADRLRTDEEKRLDEKVATWRKMYDNKRGVYNLLYNKDMPPPLYDVNVEEWMSVMIASRNVVITEAMAQKHKAPLMIETIEVNRIAWERHKESQKRWDEYRNSDEYRKSMKKYEKLMKRHRKD